LLFRKLEDGCQHKSQPLASLILLAMALVWGLAAYWFWSPDQALGVDSPLRLVIGGFLVFLMPGLTWGEILGLRSRNFLVTLALGAALSLALGLIMCPITFLLETTIRLWSTLILCLSGSGLVLVSLKILKSKPLRFLDPWTRIPKLGKSGFWAALVFLFVFVVMSFAAYRWGEDLAGISNEKLLHLQFTRLYYSLPHVFTDIGVLPGHTPPNQVHFWEYLLAGWSSLVGLDPLPVFFRARFIFPVIGLSGMYLLVFSIFLERRRTDALFAGILAMALGQLMLLSPSPLDFIKGEPSRGLMAFMGTVHHADSAMDLLLPLVMGVGLLGLRTRDYKLPIIFGLLLAVTFAWHVREFLQIAIYLALLGPILILTLHRDRRRILGRWAIFLGTFFVVAVLFAGLMKYHGRTAEHTGGYPELAIKKAAAQYALRGENLFGLRSPLNFPIYFSLSSTHNPDSIFRPEAVQTKFMESWPTILWMLLTGLAIPLLSFLGGLRDRQLALFTIGLWVLMFSWNSGLLLVILLTFSEIHVTSPRNMYLISYIVIAEALWLAGSALIGRKSDLVRTFIASTFLFVLGAFAASWWSFGASHYQTVSKVIGWSMLASLFFILLERLLGPWPSLIRSSRLPLVIVGSFLFIVPLGLQGWKNLEHLLIEDRPTINWFADDNPLGVRKEAIKIYRSLPPKSIVLVNPFEMSPFFLYAPVYPFPSPTGTVMMFNEVRREIHSGEHPLIKIGNVSRNVVRHSIPAVLRTKPPSAQTEFDRQPGAGTMPAENLTEIYPPLFTRRETERFEVRHLDGPEGPYIRIQPARKEKLENITGFLAMDLAYELGKNGLEAMLGPDCYVTFIVKCRTSPSPWDQPIMFIEDWKPDQTRDIVGARVGETEWNNYVMFKPVRPGFSELRMVLEWRSGPEDWLEVAGLSVYLTDGHPLSQDLDHQEVMKRLIQDKIDFIFLKGNAYAVARPYLSTHPETYSLILDQPDRQELMVKFKPQG